MALITSDCAPFSEFQVNPCSMQQIQTILNHDGPNHLVPDAVVVANTLSLKNPLLIHLSTPRFKERCDGTPAACDPGRPSMIIEWP